ncbi:MAG: GNAT family N-acetyltransferase [Anaerolineae bacterium]|nr:GNAT family N-acetyltransferase [Anaerolineae bacterium]
MHLRLMTPDDLDAAVDFVARLQADPMQMIAYLGAEANDIRHSLEGFEPDWTRATQLAYDGECLMGLLGVDTSETIGRAWLNGPLVNGADWVETADQLYAAAQKMMPDYVREHELFVDVANLNVAGFAARHGFVPGTPEASLRFGREQHHQLPAESESVLNAADYTSFVAIHDQLFPRTYYTGAEILEQLGERDRVFIVNPSENGLAGYIYARVEPGATNGYIDFVGVAENARRQGIGRRLVSVATRWLFTFPEVEEVTLTVNAGNDGAIALYKQLGFEHNQTLQVFRKNTIEPLRRQEKQEL